jgi:erythromycin esterase
VTCAAVLIALLLGMGMATGQSISGTVQAARGRPVCGAVVAAVPPAPGADEESTRPSALTRATCEGHFTLGPLTPGIYTVTATLESVGAAVAPGVILDDGTGHLSLRLKDSRATVTGHVRGIDGAGRPDAQVRAHHWSDDQGAVFYSATDSDGGFELTVPPGGSYFMLAVAPGARPAHAEGSPPFDGDVDFEVAEAGPAPPAVVEWIRANAVRIESASPAGGTGDLEGLWSLLSDARIVGLGTATHGTRESTQLAHRLLRLFASGRGSSALAVEASMTAGLELNDFVVHGRGEPNDSRWRFDPSEEMLNLVRWMRRHNDAPPPHHGVSLYGFDMQPPAPAAARVLRYLEDVDPSWVPIARDRLGVFVDPRTQFGGFGLEGPARQSLREGVEAVLARLDHQKPRYVAASSEGDFTHARQMARLAAQNAKIQTAGPGEFAARDRGMADNVLWILEQLPNEATLLLLGHNNHLALEPAFTMGARLRAALGPAYVSVGFVFDEGFFTAHEYAFGEIREYDRTFHVGPGPPGSLGATLSAAGLSIAALDLRTLPPGRPAAAWFSSPRETRSVGSGYFERFSGAFWKAEVLPQRYDVLLFVRETTASRRSRPD